MAGQVDVFASRYRLGAFREDIKDFIFMITPDDTPFYNSIGESMAKNVFHEWPTRALTTRSHNAQPEGDQYTIDDFTGPNLPSRLANIVQIIRHTPRVTRTAQRMQTIGVDQLMADQIRLHSIEFKTDVEHALLRGSLHSGPTNTGDTTARQLGGFHNVITDGTDLNSAGSLSETLMKVLTGEAWARGGRVQDVLVNAAWKRLISTWTAGSTKYVMAEERAIYDSVNVLENDFYNVIIRKCRDCIDTASQRSLYAYDRENFKKAWLESPFTERLPRTGDDEKAVILCEVTLEFGHPGASFKVVRGN